MADSRNPNVPVRQESGITRQSPAGGRQPFNALQQFANEVDRIFDDFGFGRMWRPSQARWMRGGWAPDVDIYQSGDQFVIKADLPGLTKDDITVDVTEHMVTIKGERKSEREEEHEGVYRSERSYGSFHRDIALPEGTITEQAKATFSDGVLQITMPSPPVSKGRRLEIGAEAKK
jgi:HSP20 family protein